MEKFVEWSDDLSVGIEEIDEQHKVLVAIINEIHTAIQLRHSSEVVQNVLNKLTEYTKIHFAVEESLMRILGYPGYEPHKGQHDLLIQSIEELRHKVATGKTAIGFELMHFLKVWLTKHIMESDRGYTGFFIESGAKPKLKKRSWTLRLWEGLRG